MENTNQEQTNTEVTETNENTNSQIENGAVQNPDSKNENSTDNQTQQTNSIPYDRFKKKVDEVNTYSNALKELGFDSIDSLKEFATTAKSLQEKEEERKRSEMTEIEKLNSDLKKAQETIENLNSTLNSTKEQTRKERVRNTFNQLATENGIGYVEDAFQLVKEQVDGLELGEDGKINGLDTIIKSLVETKPFLLKEKQEQQTTPNEIGNSSNPPSQSENNKSKQEVLKEFADRAKRSGRHEDMVAYMQKKKELGL